MNKVEEIKRLYYSATKATIQKDLARAIDLLRSMESEEERERAAVYMDGLSQMRSEWAIGARPKAKGQRPKAHQEGPKGEGMEWGGQRGGAPKRPRKR